MMLHRRLYHSSLTSSRGYTIDQTILIVAIIAILITLVIVTVGWQLINRSSGTKSAAQLRQIESANGQFYSIQNVWAPDALNTTSTPQASMAALANRIPSSQWADSIDQTKLTSLLPGFRITGTGASSALYHSFGSATTAVIREQINKFAPLGTSLYIVIEFTDMTLANAQEADRAIDGAQDATKGRVIYGSGSCIGTNRGDSTVIPSIPNPTNATVTLCYAANTI